MLIRLTAGLVLVAAPLVQTCASPTDVRTEAARPVNTPTSDAPKSLAIQAPAVVLVHDNVLLGATAFGPTGAVALSASDVVWSSDDSATAFVSSRGVLTSRRTGSVHITARYRWVEATAFVHIQPRIRVLADYVEPGGLVPWYVGTGDSLHLTTLNVDVDGRRLGEAAEVHWSSSDPGLVSVDDNGLVVGRAYADPERPIQLTAATAHDTAVVAVFVADAFAGRPASVRFANAVPNADPLTFVPSKGPPVTLGFGEYADIPVLSGMLTVRFAGFPVDYPGNPLMKPNGYRALIRAGESPALYIAPGREHAFMALSKTVPRGAIPSDKSYIHLVQGTGPGIVYLRAPEELATGLPELCYFDPTDQATFVRPAGDVDIIGAPKYGSEGLVRFRVHALGGRQSTIVLTASTPTTANFAVFPDP